MEKKAREEGEGRGRRKSQEESALRWVRMGWRGEEEREVRREEESWLVMQAAGGLEESEDRGPSGSRSRERTRWSRRRADWTGR